MKKHMYRLVSLLTICLAVIFCGCSHEYIGIMQSGEHLVIGDISYIPDETETAEQDKLIGNVRDSENREYRIYTVKNDNDRNQFIAVSGDEKKYFRKEFNAMSTEIRTVAFNGKTMDYFRFGNENGRPLLILPGLSLKSVMGSADAVVNGYALPAQDYDIYLFERIRACREGYTIEDMADDMLAVLKELNLTDVDIIGVSQGGMIALSMALKSPETVHSLVLSSTAARISQYTKDTVGQWREYAKNRDLASLSKAFGENVYTPAFFEQYREIILAANADATDEECDRFVIAAGAINGFDVYEQLPEIKCPVYVISAGEDRVLGPEAGPEMMEKLGCDGYIYEGRGHGVYDEAPDYLSRVKAFLDQQN